MKVEQLVILLKGAATRELQNEGTHPMMSYAQQARNFPNVGHAVIGKCFCHRRMYLGRSGMLRTTH